MNELELQTIEIVDDAGPIRRELRMTVVDLLRDGADPRKIGRALVAAKEADLEEEPTVCTKCELSFKSFADYHKHKVHSRRHITCEVCSQDFEGHEACKQHHDLVSAPAPDSTRVNASQMHSHEQDMSCPGCNKHFTRLGGLMSHIELAECKYFQREIVEKNRKMKQNWYSNAQNARNFQDYGRTAGDFDNNSPSPFTAPQPHKLLRGPEGVMLVTADGELRQVAASSGDPVVIPDHQVAEVFRYRNVRRRDRLCIQLRSTRNTIVGGAPIEPSLAAEISSVNEAEAAAWGLVNRVVEPADLLETTLGIARRIAANGPIAVRQAKQ